jgi:hypothetical protein
MPLEPGPFSQAPAADVFFPAVAYDFTDDALTLSGELDAIASGWDGFFTDAGNLAAEGADVAIGLDWVYAVGWLLGQAGALPRPDLDIVDQGFASAAGMLNDAVAFAPAQAWQDPGAPFLPPDSALTLAVPSVPTGAFVPAPNFTVGASGAGATRFVGLYNTTRVGATNFVVGDQFTLLALGNPGDDLTVDANFNGEQLPSSDYGPIDSTQQLFIKGTMAPENVGVWREDWSLSGQLMASFNFVVSNS